MELLAGARALGDRTGNAIFAEFPARLLHSLIMTAV
jgi:hypothetical protein